MALIFKGVREPVKIGYPYEYLLRIFTVAAIWSHRTKIDLRISSMNDHKHMQKSLHYADAAVDFICQHKNGRKHTAAHERLATYLKGQIGPGYDVINEKHHVHVEFDGYPRNSLTSDETVERLISLNMRHRKTSDKPRLRRGLTPRISKAS